MESTFATRSTHRNIWQKEKKRKKEEQENHDLAACAKGVSETSKQDIRTTRKIIVLIVVYALFVPFSLLWYYTLTSLDCKNPNFGLDHVTVGSSMQKQHGCYDNMQWHWIAYSAINGMIFAASLFAVARTLHKNRRWNERLG